MFPIDERNNGVEGCDFILLSHAHSDHSADSIEIAEEKDIPIVLWKVIPSYTIINTPNVARKIEKYVPIISLSLRNNHPKTAARNGVILKINKVDDTELFSIANTYIENAMARFSPIKKSLRSRLRITFLGVISRRKHIKIKTINANPNDR